MFNSKTRNILSLNFPSKFILSLTIMMFFSLPLFSLNQEFDFMGLKLGMSEAEVQTAIIMNTNLLYDDTRFLGKINEAYPFTIRATFVPYIEKIYIDFYEGTSYQMTFNFSEDYFDYYTLSETLSEKYGNPNKWTTKKIQWFDTNQNVNQQDIRMTLEYPSTLKVFNNNAMMEMYLSLSQMINIVTNDTVDRQVSEFILNEL